MCRIELGFQFLSTSPKQARFFVGQLQSFQKKDLTALCDNDQLS